MPARRVPSVKERSGDQIYGFATYLTLNVITEHPATFAAFRPKELSDV